MGCWGLWRSIGQTADSWATSPAVIREQQGCDDVFLRITNRRLSIDERCGLSVDPAAPSCDTSAWNNGAAAHNLCIPQMLLVHQRFCSKAAGVSIAI